MQHDESTNSTNPRRESSQVTYPWRATLRTVIVAAIGLLPLLPEIAKAAHVETVPVVVATLTITAAIQRVLAVPGVDKWLRDNTQWLSSEPYEGKHRLEDE